MNPRSCCLQHHVLPHVCGCLARRSFPRNVASACPHRSVPPVGLSPGTATVTPSEVAHALRSPSAHRLLDQCGYPCLVGRIHLLGLLAHRGSFLFGEPAGRLAGAARSGLASALGCAHRECPCSSCSRPLGRMTFVSILERLDGQPISAVPGCGPGCRRGRGMRSRGPPSTAPSALGRPRRRAPAPSRRCRRGPSWPA